MKTWKAMGVVLGLALGVAGNVDARGPGGGMGGGAGAGQGRAQQSGAGQASPERVRSEDQAQIRAQNPGKGAEPQQDRSRLRDQEAVGTQERLRDRERIHTPPTSPVGN